MFEYKITFVVFVPALFDGFSHLRNILILSVINDLQFIRYFSQEKFLNSQPLMLKYYSKLLVELIKKYVITLIAI